MALASNQICSMDDIAAEVTAGRMVWSGAAQSGGADITWSQFKTYVLYDGTNPDSLADNQCPRYDKLLARAIIPVPSSVVLTNTTDCPTCTYSVTLSYVGRPSGWDAETALDAGAFVNRGQVDSFQFSGVSQAAHTAKVRFTNGTYTTGNVTSNSVTVSHCGGCP